MAAMTEFWETRLPAIGVRPFVERYIGYRLAGFPPGLHRGLPSRHMTFIVSIGDPIDVVAQTSPDQDPQKYGCVVSGLQASPASIAHDGNQEGVAIELSPLGSRALLGVPAGALWDLSIELADVVGPSGSELWERLQGTIGWNERFAVCDEVLLALVDSRFMGQEMGRAWSLLVGSGGRQPVRELAAEVGYSRQHFGRRFRAEFGLSPKLAARVVRFDRARQMLQTVPSYISISQVAVSCGYYDQAHLNRDFAELGGCTPSQLFDDLPTVGSENHAS